MRPRAVAWFYAGIAVTWSTVPTSTVRAEDARPGWNQKATQQYLDSRVRWWLDWAAADRGQGTACASCHTTLPYALTLPAFAKSAAGSPAPEVAERLFAGVRKRVEKWDLLDGAETGKGLAPISGGARRDAAIDTESVLNAVVLVANDRHDGALLSEAASKSLDIMWSRQQANGAWRWLEFGLRPWEMDGDYFGATLAAIAASSAGSKYPLARDSEIVAKKLALNGFLKSRLAEKPLLHNRALALWAASHQAGLFTGDEKKAMANDLFTVQGPDSGWSLRDLGKSDSQPDSRGWNIVASYPQGSVSDGYATGLVVLALKRSGVARDDPRLRKGIEWLTTHQASDGTWPTVWVNKDRDPQGNVGKFNRDAGAGFALLALAEAQ